MDLALYYLLNEMQPGVDPLGPDNKLIFSTSVVTGLPVPGLSRYTVAAKSPQTGTYGEAEAGGYWGPELKFAGFDAIVIEGRSEEPVYLWVHDSDLELRDASHLWGKTTGETQNAVREELGDRLIRLASIGLGGENLVRYACILNELKYANGRSGLGAVMGSKKLKAIAVRGRSRMKVKDRDVIQKLAAWFGKKWRENPASMARHRLGTAGVVLPLNADGTLPTENFKEGTFENAESISGEKMEETILANREGCYACPVRCKRAVRAEGRFATDPRYGGPEYETIAAFGSLCRVDDINAVSKANELCNMHSLDTISTGATIAFAMECYENGLISKKDTRGMELRFGSEDAIVRLTEMIAKREGIGDLLAEGVARAAQKIGGDAQRWALTVKGKEVPMHEPRSKPGVGLAYALSPIGADHLQAVHDPTFSKPSESLKPIGLTEPVDRFSLGAKKVRAFLYLQLWWGLFNMLDLCVFPFIPHPVGNFQAHHVVELVNAATGWNTSIWELMKASERALNMARCFNVREGFKRSDDELPERFFQPLVSGTRSGAKISRDKFDDAVTLYYSMMGWNVETGVPTGKKLEELGLNWLASQV
ncbi:MAG: aldehyde ferredoxin oxidoreductase family protein [Nitrososphaeria archaeon]